MAGKVTHLMNWADDEGGWVLPYTLESEVRSGLEDAIGFHIDDNKIHEIEKNIASLKFLKTSFPEATSQDIKRSLANIGKLSPEEALSAYHKSDSSTQALINDAIFFNLGICPSSSEWEYPNGTNIARAEALASHECRKNGRPFLLYRRHLASYALSLWRQLGGGECKAWSLGDIPSPIVSFMVSLSLAVDNVPLNITTAVSLLNEPRVVEQSLKRA